MVLFWSLAALILALSLVFFWWPLKTGRGERIEDVDRNKLNVQIFKDRVGELEEELKQGNLSQENFEELKAELEKNLLEEVEETGTQGHRANTRGLSIVLSIAVPALALVLYLQWGASDRLAMPPQQQAAHPNSQHSAGGMEEQIAALKARLEQNPNNSQGWFTLGRTYLTLQRYQEAYDAFGKVGEIVGEAAEILSQQAQALYFLNNRQFTPQVEGIVRRALELDPEDPATLGLLGIYAYERGQYQEAIEYWQRVIRGQRPNANIEGLKSAVEQARARLAEQGIEYTVEEPVAAAAAEVKVLVELDAKLAEQVSPDTTVFVFAQAVQGPRMPLAAARLQVKDLPTLVTLDDSMAMGPMAKLSSQERVQIRATVSRSGTPGAKTGDLSGMVGPVPVKGGQEVVKVMIDQVVQ